MKLEVDSETKFFDDHTGSVNVIGEIEGGRKKDEIVMVGAHLDSWQGGTGATDNAAGSAVMMETMRILKTLNLKMDRTVRIALWGGEEEGLLGSRAYVKEHFGDPETMKLGPEHARLDGYFNVDNGTGKIRGIYLQGNEMTRPIFESWLAPFHDLGASTIASVIPEEPTTCPLMRSGYRVSNSFRSRWSITPVRITPTWTCTIVCNRAI